MTWARPAYQWLAWIFLVALGVQFFLAGMGVLGGEEIDPHQAFGSLLQLVSLVMLILAIVAKLGGKLIGMSVVLLVLMVLQSVFAQPDLDPIFLRTFHVFDAFLIVGLVYNIATKMGSPLQNT